MRFVTEIKGLWFLHPYFNHKLELCFSILDLFEKKKIIYDLEFDWAYLQAVPVADYFDFSKPPILEHIELLPRGVRGVGLERFQQRISQRMKTIRTRLRITEAVIAIGIRGYFFGLEFAGSIRIRGTGKSRRSYGDIEIMLYNLRNGLHDMKDFYLYLIKENKDKDAVKNLAQFSEEMIKKKFELARIKEIYIQEQDSFLRTDLDRTVFAAHSSPKSHLAFIIRFIKKRKASSRKYRDRIEIYEEKVLKKLSGFINPSTIYNKVGDRSELVRATIKSYSDEGYIASAGSLIVGTVEHDSLFRGYTRFLRDVLLNLVESFPDESDFETWLRRGLEKLKGIKTGSLY